MKKIFILISFTIFVLVLSILILLSWFWLLSGGASVFIKTPKPERTYAEFPFCITYELNGETIIIEDRLVCQFDGFEIEGGVGKRRKWKTFIQGTETRMITLCDLRDKKVFTNWGNQILELCYDPGNAEYYMGDIDGSQNSGNMGNWIDYIYITENGKTGYSAFEAAEAWDKYRIKIIDWKISKPIKNTFS